MSCCDTLHELRRRLDAGDTGAAIRLVYDTTTADDDRWVGGYPSSGRPAADLLPPPAGPAPGGAR